MAEDGWNDIELADLKALAEKEGNGEAKTKLLAMIEKIEDKKKIKNIALDHEKDMIFHYANQSLFADLLKAIQNRLIR